MVAFRNHAHDFFKITHSVTLGNRAIAFGRGDRGFVVINAGDSPIAKRALQTPLRPGPYRDLLSCVIDAAAGSCGR